VAAGEASNAGLTLAAAQPLARDARSARTLAPAIDALLRGLGWPPASLAAIAVTSGPGSFTGLRVGVVTAKTLAYATGAAVLGVDTLDALAEAADPPERSGGRLLAALDAQRGEFFAAPFIAEAGGWRRDGDTTRRTRRQIDEALTRGDRVVGPVADRLAGIDGATPADAEPTAEAVLRVARRRWLAGAAESVFALTPAYHRQSAAEEKAAGQP